MTSIIEDADEYFDAEICMARPQRKYIVNIYANMQKVLLHANQSSSVERIID